MPKQLCQRGHHEAHNCVTIIEDCDIIVDMMMCTIVTLYIMVVKSELALFVPHCDNIIHDYEVRMDIRSLTIVIAGSSL